VKTILLRIISGAYTSSIASCSPARQDKPAFSVFPAGTGHP
jgi:hypothetical protein